MRRRPLSVYAAACAAALTLTACLPGEGGSESSSSSNSSSSGSEADPQGKGDTASPSSSETEPVPEESFDAPEQQEVDAPTARKALPGKKGVPDKSWEWINWSANESTATYDPKECAAVEFASDSIKSYQAKHRTAHEYIHYKQDKSKDMLHVSIESFDTPYPLAYFDGAGESIGNCSTYTAGESGVKYSASPVPAPPLGERSLGVRLTGYNGGGNIDLLYVRSGHNLVTAVRYTKDKNYDERLLKRYATDVLTDLKKAS